MQLYHLVGNRLLRLASVCLAACFAAHEVAAETQPYQARIVVARAQVRSGPGENFYPTDALAQGETVEVYREQPGGWLAIRPPKESFSWVFARHLKVREDRLGEIDKEDVASRIGSLFGNKRNAVQVRLQKGEVVEILGEEKDGGETWYKIAPPAGEFRWVHATNVERIGPLAVAEPAEPVVVAASATHANQADKDVADKSEPNDDKPAALSAEPEVPPSEDWRAAPGASASSSPDPSPPLATPVGSSPSATTPAAAETPAAQPQGSAKPARQLPDELGRRLTDIELRLSRMVAAPPSQWNTERLERDTEELLAQAQSAVERDAIKATLAKLDHFASIARRYQQQVAPGLAASGQPVGGLSEADGSLVGGVTSASETPPTTGAPGDAGRYDAVGILRPVVSKRAGAPQFAIVDERGQVISFVTPTPDLNLQPYLGHRVGVTGTRGFISEFQRAHVTAGRVTPLSERLVR